MEPDELRGLLRDATDISKRTRGYVTFPADEVRDMLSNCRKCGDDGVEEMIIEFDLLNYAMRIWALCPRCREEWRRIFRTS